MFALGFNARHRWWGLLSGWLSAALAAE